MNSKPGPGFTAQNHCSFTNAAGTTDCASCHSWPGTGTAVAPNWLGAIGGMPKNINVGGFAIPQPPATTASTQVGISNLPHPTVAAGTACTSCHSSSSGGSRAIGYDHASGLISSNCASCHEAGSHLVGTVWNNAASAASGAGDTRPFTLSSIVASRGGSQLTVNYPKHFYPVDCNQCHTVSASISTVKTGANYMNAWNFPHNNSKMTNPSTCKMCH